MIIILKSRTPTGLHNLIKTSWIVTSQIKISFSCCTGGWQKFARHYCGKISCNIVWERSSLGRRWMDNDFIEQRAFSLLLHITVSDLVPILHGERHSVGSWSSPASRYSSCMSFTRCYITRCVSHYRSRFIAGALLCLLSVIRSWSFD